MKNTFEKLVQKDREQAAALINAKGLRFATFFSLVPAINEANLYNALSPQNQIAFALASRVLTDLQIPTNLFRQSSDSGTIQAVLRWVLKTGAAEDGMSDEFDQALDIAAALLVRTCQDTTVLPELVYLVFKRNRKGLYMHDLLWTLFGSCEPTVLRLIASHLKSANPADVQLAEKLLSQTKALGGFGEKLQFAPCLSWLKENQPYLYFTGEGFHQKSNPILYNVDLGAKYLCKHISPQSKKPLADLSQDEETRLGEFHQLSDAQKINLSGYSHRLHAKNKQRWGKWMAHPPNEQAQFVRDLSGGTR